MPIHIPRIGESPLQPLTQSEQRIAQEVARLKDARKAAEAKERAINRRFTWRRIAALTGLVAVAGTSAALIVGPEKDTPNTIYHADESAYNTAKKALLTYGETRPTPQEVNAAVEDIAEANPDKSFNSGDSLHFESDTTLILPEEVTQQN